MTTPTMRPPLVRPRSATLGGVCAGLASHLGWPLPRVRFLMVALTAFFGAGLLFYLWLWALTPLATDDSDSSTGVTRTAPTSALLLAGGAVFGLVSVIQANAAREAFTPIMLAVVLTGSAVAWSLTLDRRDSARSARYMILVRSFSVAVLLGAGLLLLFSAGGHPDALVAVLAIAMLILGLGVMVAPLVVRLWSDLMAERAGRVREEQRAEIAAHLHDSVLQTLALIQNRAGASSEVARLARAQERELRDWLFAGSAPIGSDLVSELREIAAAIELDYPARLEVVAVGEPALSSAASGEPVLSSAASSEPVLSSTAEAEPSRSSAALVAATREAMLNAARHAGGEVSVYIESSPSATDVFVRDRGPGVDLLALPADRLGVRESIIGRMARAGGTATVKPGAGGVGTEVHLHLETPNEQELR